MKPFQIFDPSIKNRATKIFGGQSSGMCDWDDIKYPSMLQLNEEMFSNLWSLGKVSLKQDFEDFESLLEKDKDLYLSSLRRLRDLSLLTEKFNFHVGFVSSDPSIQQNTQLVGTIKGVHSLAYDRYLSGIGKGASTVGEDTRFESVHAPIRRFLSLSEQSIRSSAEWGKEDIEALRGALATFLVATGVVFHVHSLPLSFFGRRGEMKETADTLQLIRMDEARHLAFYGEVLRILNNEETSYDKDDFERELHDLLRSVVSEGYREVFGPLDDFPESLAYLQYRANQVCVHAGIRPLFLESIELNIPWLADTNPSTMQPVNLSTSDEDDFDW